MKNLYIISAFLIAVNLVFAQNINTPLLISGRIFDSAGGQIPQADLRLKVFLEIKPSDLLSEQSPSCGYQAPVWFAEIGNLSTSWHYRDKLVILIEYIRKSERVRYVWEIDSTAQVPVLYTQKITNPELISGFRLSDRGVMDGRPLNFQFESSFSDLSGIELRILSVEGLEIYKSGVPAPIGENLYQFSWNGRTTNDRRLRSGIYFYFLIGRGETIHSGIVTLKNE